jgi:excisionase family DNA binding protein
VTAINSSKPALLTSEELAAHLKISVRTLTAMRDEGKIPFLKVSPRGYRYDLAEVETKLREAK